MIHSCSIAITCSRQEHTASILHFSPSGGIVGVAVVVSIVFVDILGGIDAIGVHIYVGEDDKAGLACYRGLGKTTVRCAVNG